MTLMDAMRVIESEHPAIVHSRYMWQEEGEIVANDLTPFVDPNLFAKDAYPTCAPKLILLIGVLAKVNPSAQGFYQVMPLTQHLP
jgi:hypothetical protein